MIDLRAAEPTASMSQFGAQLFTEAVRSARTAAIQSVATNPLVWDFGPERGEIEFWTLTKPLGKYPAGSTHDRAEIERLLFPKSGKYGGVTVNPNDPAIKAVETPAKDA